MSDRYQVNDTSEIITPALLLGAGLVCAGCGGNAWQSRKPLFGGQASAAPAAAPAATAAAPPVDPAQVADLDRAGRVMHAIGAERVVDVARELF